MLIHASCVAIKGQAVLLAGPPGIGKSDVALRLVDGGGQLVADDQVLLRCGPYGLHASPPAVLKGLFEIRHIGLVKMDFVEDIPVALYVELQTFNVKYERLPEDDLVFFLDQSVQRLRLPAFAASTPAKIRAALTFGRHND